MQDIYDYLDQLFDKLPQTDELREEKQRMIVVVQQEYSKLIAQGASEQTARERIMNGFHSLDALANQVANSSGRFYNGIPVIDSRLAEDYVRTGKTAAFLKACGIGLFFVGAAIQNFAEVFHHLFGGFIGGIAENGAAFLSLGLIVVSVLCFVQGSRKKRAFDFLQNGNYMNSDGKAVLDKFLQRGFSQQKALVAGILLLLVGTPMVSGMMSIAPFSVVGILADSMATLTAGAGIFTLVFRESMNRFMTRCRNLLNRTFRIDR